MFDVPNAFVIKSQLNFGLTSSILSITDESVSLVSWNLFK